MADRQHQQTHKHGTTAQSPDHISQQTAGHTAGDDARGGRDVASSSPAPTGTPVQPSSGTPLKTAALTKASAITRRTATLSLAGGLAGAALLPAAASAKIDWDGYPRLMDGPRLGWSGPNRITVRVRASGPFPVQLETAATRDMADARLHPPVIPSQDAAFVAQLVGADLPAGQEVFYRVLVDGKPEPDLAPLMPFAARTAPAGPAAFSLAFGSCARIARHPRQPIWDAIAREEPDLFLWLGDNIYGDSLDPAILTEEYRRQLGLPEYQPVARSVVNLAIWDDHDYGLNDHDRRHPRKAEALAVFTRTWANPAYGLADTPGVFFSYSYGGVDFFFLDNRYHRAPAEDPDGPDKPCLGAAQLAWLKQGLAASTAPFKVLVSGMPFNDAKGPGAESWSAFTYERDALFDFIRDEAITGVVLLSGDTHIGELNAIPRRAVGGYDLYEFVSSPLAQEPSPGSWLNYRAIARIRQVYFGGPNYGRVAFDMTAPDPVCRFTLHNVFGQAVWAPFEVRASELVNGAGDFRAKMDARSLERWDRAQAGGAYYASRP